MRLFRFIAENGRWIGGGFGLCFFSSFGQTFYISLSAGHIRDRFDLSHGDFGALYMLATLGSALVLPQLGRIVDHLSMARVVAIIVPALALATFAMALVETLVGLVLTLFCLRLFGQGMMVHTAMTAMGRWFSAQRGKAVSLSTLGLQAGEATLPTLVVVLFAAIGWRATWLLAAAALILIALPALHYSLSQARTPVSPEGGARHVAPRDWTRRQVLRDPIFWLMLAGVLAPGFIGTTIFFHQVYLVELRGWTLEVFATSFTGMALMTVTFAVLTGELVDRLSAISMLPVLLLPLSAACFALTYAEAWWGAYLVMGLVGVSYGVSSTLFGALWPEVYGVRHLGSVRAAIVAMMVLATALGPGVTGALIDHGISLPRQMLGMGAYCLVCSVLLHRASHLIRSRNAVLEQTS